MFKKLGVLTLTALLCLSIAGCSAEDEKKESTKLDKNLPKVETATEPEVKQLTLDDALLSKIKDSCSKFTYLRSSQKMTSYSILNDKKDNERTIADVSIEVDAKNNIVLTEMKSNYTDDKEVVYSFADDNKNNIHISKIDDGEYVASDDLNATLGVDYSKITNAYEYVLAMCNNNLPKDAVATEDEGKYIFKLERDATKTDLTGTEYDSLGTTTVEFELSENEDGVLTPKSISMNTTFFIGQIEYGVSTVCTFSDFSTNEISFPSYEKTK